MIGLTTFRLFPYPKKLAAVNHSSKLSLFGLPKLSANSFSDEIVVQIVDNPIISLTSTAFASSASSSAFCEGEAITFNVTSTSAIATYTFIVGSSAVSVTTNNFYTTVPPLSSTTSVSVRVETASGCTASQTLDMFLNEITSSGNIGQASTTICAGETPPAFTNVASATGVGTISYQWQSRTFATDFINVPVSATTQVYTETSALGTTTFYRRAAISTFGGKQCEENSNVIEIGTFDGKTTINCAINLINSKIYTLDLPEDEDTSELKRVKEYLEYDKELIISNKRKNKKFDNINNINQIYCDSTSFDFSQIDFSLAFIDGGHDYNTVKSDTINCIENIQKPGIILWHDYDVTNPVGLYLRAISKKYKIYWIKDTRICISWIK